MAAGNPCRAANHVRARDCAWALLDGIADIVRSFTMQGLAPRWWMLLLTGAVSVLFSGAALYYYPSLSQPPRRGLQLGTARLHRP